MTDDDTTRIISRKSTATDETRPLEGRYSGLGSRDDDPHTRIYRPKKASSSEPTSGAVEVSAPGFSAEPVVGWLVVIDGPGRGQSLVLGYGVNTIGRGADARVSLDFGDEEISRNSHALLTYDTKGRKFYIQHGGATNLTYLGNVPVLQPHELHGREIIGVGNTRLIFVPFCGPDFEW